MDKMRTAALERQKTQQKMGQSKEMFPLSMQKLRSDIAKIDADTSLTPFERQYKIALAGKLGQEQMEAESLLPSKIKQAQFSADYPLLDKTGLAQDIGTLDYAARNPRIGQEFQGVGQQIASGKPEDLTMPANERTAAAIQAAGGKVQANAEAPSLLDFVKQRMSVDQELKADRAGFYKKQTETANYRTLPIDQKSALLAQAAGFGIDPVEATQAFINGATVKDLALKQGFNEDSKQWPDPIYAITKTELARVQQRKAALNELKILNPILTEALAPYSRRVAGLSPKQVGMAIKNDDIDSQAKFLAARALQPELAIIRMRAAQGTHIGIDAIQEMMDKSMGNVKSIQATVSPEAFSKANKYIDQWITKAVTGANSTNARWMDKISSLEKEDPKQASASAATGTPTVIGGKTYIEKDGQWYPQ
jgi:hypothetical protein